MAIQITSEQINLVITTVENDQPIFNLPCTGEEEPFYHLQADALCWQDELPEKLNYDAMRVVQFLLAARSQSYSDSQLTNSGVLEKLRVIAPNWPFLREDRHDSKWERQLIVLREKALRELEVKLEQRK